MGKTIPQPGNYPNDYPKIREQLIQWGASKFRFTDDWGRIKEREYLKEELIPMLSGNKLGELEIPTDLGNLIRDKSFHKKTKLGLLSAMMGYGHRRTASSFAWCAKALGIETQEICFGDERQKPITNLDKVFMAVNKEYFRASNREAIKKGMLARGDEYIPNYNTGWIGKAAFLLRKLAPNAYDSLFMGKTDKTINEKSVYRARKYVRYLFMRSIGTKLNAYGITNTINFYPLLNFLLNEEAVTVATDAVVNPLGWTPLVRQVLERKEALEKFSGFSENLKNNLEYGNGFAAPIPGLARASSLAGKRAEKMKKGIPITLVLPASQVATAQLESFKELIEQNLDAQIIVQCGDGMAGESLKNKLIQSLRIPDNVILYNAATPEAAIEFWEIMAGCDIPIALAVKGSELSRMAVELHIPHIALGAIGEQELWNLTVGLIQGAPLILTPRAFGQVAEFILGNNFKEDEQDWLLAKAEMAKATNYRKARERASEMITLGKKAMVPVQRDFMLKVLDFVFTGKRKIFYD